MGFAEPPVGEDGEFLGAVGFAAVEGEAAGGFAVALAFAEEAEVAGSLEGAEFVQLVGLVQRVEDAEAGVAGVGGNLVGDGEGAVIEEIADEADGLHMGEGELIHVDGFGEQVTGMKEFDFERMAALGPQGPFPAETDFAVFIVIEIVLVQDLGQVFARGMEGLPGTGQGFLRDVIEGDFGRLRGHAGFGCQQTHRHQTHTDRSQHQGDITKKPGDWQVRGGRTGSGLKGGAPAGLTLSWPARRELVGGNLTPELTSRPHGFRIRRLNRICTHHT